MIYTDNDSLLPAEGEEALDEGRDLVHFLFATLCLHVFPRLMALDLNQC